MPKSYRLLALLITLVFGASFVSFAGMSGSTSEIVAEPASFLPVAIASPIDISFEDTLQAGETISQLLQRAELAEGDAQALLDQISEFQDPRRMRPGAVVAYHRSVEDGAVRRLEFTLDADRKINILRDGDQWVGEVQEVEVTPDTVVVAGLIESSLYNALMAGDMDAAAVEERIRLVDMLADRIFAWQIDFSRDLRTGDEFRVLYERLVRPDGSTRSIRVLGAQFSINSRDFEAYAFLTSDGNEDYFDRSGESLRRAFLRAPLQYRRISSAFSSSRFHPILQVNRAHNGIDYAAAAGTPVYAVGDGVIQRAGNGGSYGNVVDINHNRGMMTRYAHLRGFAPGIRSGVAVKQGDLIGYVGSTGQATGPHLHYEFHSGGRPINPNSISDSTGDPVPVNQAGEFLDQVRAYVLSMNGSTRPVLAADRRPGNGTPVSD